MIETGVWRSRAQIRAWDDDRAARIEDLMNSQDHDSPESQIAPLPLGAVFPFDRMFSSPPWTGLSGPERVSFEQTATKQLRQVLTAALQSQSASGAVGPVGSRRQAVDEALASFVTEVEASGAQVVSALRGRKTAKPDRLPSWLQEWVAMRARGVSEGARKFMDSWQPIADRIRQNESAQVDELPADPPIASSGDNLDDDADGQIDGSDDGSVPAR
jgi:hypothetical protein